MFFTRKPSISVFLTLGFLLIDMPTYASQTWTNIAPGIEYTDIRHSTSKPWSHIHAFRIDITRNDFQSILATTLRRKTANMQQFYTLTQAPLIPKETSNNGPRQQAVAAIAEPKAPIIDQRGKVS